MNYLKKVNFFKVNYLLLVLRGSCVYILWSKKNNSNSCHLITWKLLYEMSAHIIYHLDEIALTMFITM